MKNKFFLPGIAALLLLSVASCKKDEVAINTGVTPVASLLAPVNDAQITLDPRNGGSLIFQWTAAQTPDSGLIQYEVAFAKADGDFTNPVYKVVADGTGAQTQASISQKDMNKIAAMAGIASSSSGSIKWAVMAYKVANGVISSESRGLQVTRPAGFAVVPDSLYITGTATEAGDNVANAIPLKKTEEGVFEAYTSLKPGSYSLTDHRDGTGVSYYVDENGIIKEGTTATAVADAEQAYRLSYDFNFATTTKVAIQSIGLYVSAYNTETAQLTYNGNSTWEIASVPVEFFQFSWGRDERYKLIMHTANGTEYWGSKNADNSPPSGQDATYFYLLPVTNDQWSNTYKFDHAADMRSIKMEVMLQPQTPYTHKVTVL